jgi:hypothetical protein
MIAFSKKVQDIHKGFRPFTEEKLTTRHPTALLLKTFKSLFQLKNKKLSKKMALTSWKSKIRPVRLITVKLKSQLMLLKQMKDKFWKQALGPLRKKRKNQKRRPVFSELCARIQFYSSLLCLFARSLVTDPNCPESLSLQTTTHGSSYLVDVLLILFAF